MEICKNCKYFKPLRLYQRKIKTIGAHGCISGATIAKNIVAFEETFCCIASLKDNATEDTVIVETLENDTCELFNPKE